MTRIERLPREADFGQALADTRAAAEYEGEHLTQEELAKKLGVGTAGGRIDTVDLLTACLHASLNPDIQSLPSSERIVVISSAMKYMKNLHSGYE